MANGNNPPNPAKYQTGSADWLNQWMSRSQPQFERLQKLSKGVGDVQLDIPEFDVQQGDRYTNMFGSVGRREGDFAAQSVSQALAGRGGGGIGSSLAMGAQARTAPNLQALSTGVGYDFQQYQQDLQNYMTRLGVEQTRYGAEMGALQAEQQAVQSMLGLRYNILNQIVGANLGQISAAAQIEAADISAEAERENAIWSAIGSIYGGGR